MTPDDLAVATIRLLRRRGGLPPTRSVVAPKPFDQLRWGPAVEDDTPPIVISRDEWRWSVANWPHEHWSAWRGRSAELWAVAGSIGTHEANHLAYLEILENFGV